VQVALAPSGNELEQDVWVRPPANAGGQVGLEFTDVIAARGD
jgi:hypothetical protein